MSQTAATVLIPGWMHEHARNVLGTQFRLVEIADADIQAQLSPEVRASIRGVACKARIDRQFIDSLPNLEIIANYGVGYDSVDAAYARSRNIVVTNTPEVLNEEVADLTLGLLISVVREIPKAAKFVRDGQWSGSDYPLSRLTLRNRRVGIYGMGRIGRCIARRVEAFGLPVSYYSRRPAEGVTYDYFRPCWTSPVPSTCSFPSFRETRPPQEASTQRCCPLLVRTGCSSMSAAALSWMRMR